MFDICDEMFTSVIGILNQYAYCSIFKHNTIHVVPPFFFIVIEKAISVQLLLFFPFVLPVRKVYSRAFVFYGTFKASSYSLTSIYGSSRISLIPRGNNKIPFILALVFLIFRSTFWKSHKLTA